MNEGEKEETQEEQGLSHEERDALLIQEAQDKYTGEFTHDEIYNALMYLLDVMNRSSLKWVLIGNVSEQMYKRDLPTLSADKIEAVILKQHLSRSGESMLKTIVDKDSVTSGLTFKGNLFSFTHDRVPVFVYVMDQDPGIFSNPDERIYMTEVFRFPNPYDKYLEMRGLNNDA